MLSSRLVASLLGFTLLLLAAPGEAAMPQAPAPEAAHSRELVVLNYNVKGLPLITDLDRLREIGRILADRRARGAAPDIVLLQEAFSRKSKRIRNQAGYPYAVVGTPEGSHVLFPNPSGLEILSNFPIVAQYSRSYNSCAFPECFITKSVLGVTIDIPGVPAPIQIFDTHLQADSHNDYVRKNQIDDISVFLRRIGFGEQPAIFAGDFNFKPRHASYQKFLRELPFFVESGRFCLDEPRSCEIQVGGLDAHTDLMDVWHTAEDRQFFYAPESSPVRIEPVWLTRNFTEPYRGEPLSDHWGYEVRYRITW